MNHKTKILLVDDEYAILDFMMAALTIEGYSVTCASDGNESVAKVSAEKFDLAVMDIMMPGMDGITALGEIKKIDPEIEVIMATGHGTMSTAIQSLRKGAFDYLRKPFEIKELLAVVEKALEKRRFNDLTKAIFSTIKSEELLRIIIDSVTRTLKADEAALVLWDKGRRPYIAVSEGLEDEARKLSRLELCTRAMTRFAKDGINPMMLIEEPLSDAEIGAITGIGEIKFTMLLPIMEENTFTGIINISRRQSGEHFTENDMQRAKIFGSLVNLALRNSNLYKQLQETQSQLVQAEKMSALGQLAGGLAHEINNPLSGILGLTQLVLENSDQKTQNYQDLKEIEKAVFRCKKIISSLLSFARQEKPRMEPVNISEAIEETLVLCARQLELKGIKIIRDFAPELPQVTADFQQLMQVFLNMLTNAWDAMADGGVLTISTRLTKSAGARTEVEIAFSDTGPGIPGEVINRVFDPFFTTKPVGKGTGLGLSVCLGIINRHNGRIEAQSPVNGGSVFKIYLPV
ncbi:MAG: response regulator [Elusimicrobia bacterium]|nr:response regulator [Elusimicrobiota bacterium]